MIRIGLRPHISFSTDSVYWQCTRKKAYATRKIALMAAAMTRCDEVHPYKCPHCRRCHIGRTPRTP